MPHAVAIDEASACCLGDTDHATVDVSRNAAHHMFGRRTETLWPILTDEIMIAADPPGGDDHGLRPEREVAGFNAGGTFAAGFGGCFEQLAAHAGRRAGRHLERIDPMPELEDDAAVLRMLPGAPLERFHDTGAGAPRDVKPRH